MHHGHLSSRLLLPLAWVAGWGRPCSMTQRAEVCLAGMLSSKHCCNYQKQLTAMGLWGHCSKDNNQKEAGSQAVPSNSALLTSGDGHLSLGECSEAPVDKRAEDYTWPASPAHNIG